MAGGRMRDDMFKARGQQASVPTYTLNEGPDKDPGEAIVTDDGRNSWTDEEHERRSLLEGLKIWANVGVELGHKLDRDRHERLVKAREEALQRNTPAFLSLASAGIMPSSGPLILNLGSPDLGTYWEVQQWSIGGNDINVAAAGIAGLYVTSTSTLAGLGMSNLNDNTNKSAGPSATSSMPYSNFYGGQKIIVAAQESLVVGIFNGTANQQYVTTCNVTSVNVAAAQGKDVSEL